MKFSCMSTEFSQALSNTSRAVASRSSLAALEGVLLEVLEDKLCVVGYNFDIAITTNVAARIEEPGRIVLGAKIFTELVRRLPDSMVEVVSTEDSKLKITCGNIVFDIVGMEAQTYPELPVVETSDTITMNAEKFKAAVLKTIYAASVDETKLVYTGVLLNFDAGAVSMVALDGFRMAIVKESVDSKLSSLVICPSRSLSEVARLITDLEKEISIDIDRGYVMFRVGAYTVITKLIEGRFLDYAATIPKEFTTELVAKTQELIDSVERTAVVVQNKLKAPILLEIEDQLIKMSCEGATGAASDELPCSTLGAPLTISFNSRLLLEALRASNSEEIRFKFSGNLAPSILESTNTDNGFLFMVLPVRRASGDAEA